MKYPLILFTSFFILIGCSSGTEQPKAENPAPVATDPAPAPETFPTGQVIDNVACKADTSIGYAMYLPKAYDITKTYPIIYAFDPHKTGKLPVTKYKELAEKYGYIIVGSNNSQNGLEWGQSQNIASALFSDTRSRLAINTNRIYLLGFSGGARVANALTMMNGAISGVICCGAASPVVSAMDARNNYNFFGIAGTADFNYSEIRKYDMLDLAGRNLKHAMITFDGKHEWPPAEQMDEAFLWLELNNMRTDAAAKKDSLVAADISAGEKKLGILLKANKEYDAYELCRKIINYYEGLGDLSTFYAAYKRLQSSPAVDKQLKENEAGWTREEKLKEEYINNLQTHDFAWMRNDINAINQQIKAGKDKKEVLIKKRLLSYLSLVCYMQTSGSLKQHNLQAAEYFDNLYLLVDPTNSEAHYFNAEINAQKGNKEVALKALDEAIKNGFSEKARMQSDSAFQELKKDAAFEKVIEKIK
jgi:hypothetical protein